MLSSAFDLPQILQQKVELEHPFVLREVVHPLSHVVRRVAPTLGWQILKVVLIFDSALSVRALPKVGRPHLSLPLVVGARQCMFFPGDMFFQIKGAMRTEILWREVPKFRNGS